MKIYTALQIGDYHINHCEDYLFSAEINNEKILCAVMDGCTMGKDSYFVSTLVGKLFRKIVKELEYESFYANDAVSTELEPYLKKILHKLFLELNASRNLLMLQHEELLTTLIVLLIDKKTNQGIVLVLGDGMVSINGIHTEFDQDNKPDYLGFHLGEIFDIWYEQQTQILKFTPVKDISIATDGITMFAQVKKVNTTDTIDPIDFLLSDRTHLGQEDMFSIKLKNLEFEYGLKPTDDLAIIRIVNG